MKNSKKLLVVAAVGSVALGGCATPTTPIGKIGAALCDGISFGACTQTGPFFGNEEAMLLADRPCPTDKSMTKDQVAERIKNDGFSPSCVFDKIERFYSSQEAREEFARDAPNRAFADALRGGHGPMCRIDPVYVTQVPMSQQEKIMTECKGGTQESHRPKSW
ncbi:hypothetical protein BH20PSE1_BH20PSE1_07250 [soil metagenome]